jgi:uncharacterized protein (TIGR02231 family)
VPQAYGRPGGQAPSAAYAQSTTYGLFGGQPQQQQQQDFSQTQLQTFSAPRPPAQSIPAPVTRGGFLGFGGALSSKRKESVPSGAPGGSSGSDSDGAADEDEGGDYDDGRTLGEGESAALAFKEGSSEEFGLTTTYDVPGLRTLEPSKLARRHVIAQIELRNIELSYTIIPKLRTAAFLKTRIRNLSTVALLRGQAGLTLDGSFLGNTVIPRCSPDETFPLALGVDPSIQVSYAKPVMKMSTTGIFNKEDAVVYTRTMLLTNTKPQALPVELLVLDQVPVSEDERLKINIREPRGLKSEGDSAKTGTAGNNKNVAGAGNTVSRTQSVRSSVIADGSGQLPVPALGQSNWGSAVATLKKNGEINWNVKLNKGQSCRLLLEYDARVPSGEVITGIS